MVVGELVDCHAVEGRTLTDLLNEVFGEYDFPIAQGLAFGHTPVKHTLPIGGTMVVDGTEGTLRLREPWVAPREAGRR